MRSVRNLEVKIPANLDANSIDEIVENVCAEENLAVTMKSTLKKYPGCVHWHFKKATERGILEVTWWPRSGDGKASHLWLSVHGNRTADWISELVPHLVTSIEQQFQCGN